MDQEAGRQRRVGALRGRALRLAGQPPAERRNRQNQPIRQIACTNLPVMPIIGRRQTTKAIAAWLSAAEQTKVSNLQRPFRVARKGPPNCRRRQRNYP